MRVVLYMRYSSEKQTDQSIEGQERVCRAYCERMGHEVVDTYIDRATSAFHDTEKRVSFLKMIKDSEKHTFDAVCVYKLDRFARNRYDSAIYKNKLSKNGVRILSATESLSDSPEGVLLESLLEGMAEFYSKELSQKVLRGMNETAMKGNSCGGRISIGYKIVDKKYVEDPETAPLVREAFRRYADGERIVDIMNDFNARGFKTAMGVPFTPKSFHSIFQNERYIGIYRYRDVVIENAVPALIDKSLFNKVQEILHRRANSPRMGVTDDTYLLIGKIYCGHCGVLMLADSGTSKTGTRYHYYACPTARRLKKCDKKRIPRDYIEDAVINTVKELFTHEYIKAYAHAAAQEAERVNADNPDIPVLEANLKENEKKLNNLMKALELGSASAPIVKRIDELNTDIESIKNKIDRIKNEMIYIDEDLVCAWLGSFLKGNTDSKRFKEALIKCIVHQVFVYDTPDGYRLDIVTCLDPACHKTVSIEEVRHSTSYGHHKFQNRTFIIGIDSKFMVLTKTISSRR